ncbi:flavin-containing monooxygenase [uncultured Nostoc sp.]|uniref:flavin-containing monooxygenase n=1 Tax=uncultured Nostoc sp. TaxID=340711 RepID=UPI0035CC336D
MFEQVDVLIIGAGQAGLAMGYQMIQQNRKFVILEQSPQIAHSWRTRWDSLKLITPNPYNNLPGLAFPQTKNAFPTKEETIAYLELYAKTFELPIRFNEQVTSVKQIPVGFLVESSNITFQAQQIVIASGPYQKPKIPNFATQLPQDVFQIHSSHYRNPQQLQSGDVLVVGSGNSGVQIARELSTTHKVYLSVSKTPHLPRKFLGRDLCWWMYSLKVTSITKNSRLGQKLSQRPDAVIGVDIDALAKQNGIILLERVDSVEGNKIICTNKQSIEVSNIIWATGFQPDYHWIKIPVFDEKGFPVHEQGVTAVKGLYFVGLRWQQRLNSSLLGGLAPDVSFIASQIAAKALEDFLTVDNSERKNLGLTKR